MPMSQLSKVIKHLRGIVHQQEAQHTSNGRLLELFITQRDETAFEELMRRHGPMVWGVCRRVLSNAHDAEDAFQAGREGSQPISIPDCLPRARGRTDIGIDFGGVSPGRLSTGRVRRTRRRCKHHRALRQVGQHPGSSFRKRNRRRRGHPSCIWLRACSSPWCHR
jgi:Sigma-70 region 2